MTLFSALQKFRCLAMCMLMIVPVFASAQEIGRTKPRTVNLHSVAGKKSSNPEIDPEIEKMLHFFDEKINFVQNKGQWGPEVLYKAQFSYGQAAITKDGIILTALNRDDVDQRFLQSNREEEARSMGREFNEAPVRLRGHSWKVRFMNPSDKMAVSGVDQHEEEFNYFVGNNSSTGAGSFQEIWYKNVYQNVDVRYYPAADGSIEYDVVCMPGFNQKEIAVSLDGIERIALGKNGNLVVSTSVGEMSLPKPVAYQVVNGVKAYVDVEIQNHRPQYLLVFTW